MSKLSLTVKDLEKSFGKKKAVDHVSFEIHSGVHALLGPNGSGKTTLLRCIAHVYSNYKGEIILTDESENKIRKQKIGYLPQKFDLFEDVTVWESMKFFCSVKDMKRKEMQGQIDAVLMKVGLYDLKKEKCGNLSGGMIRRIGIAQAFLNHPDIVILDEPTVGLDPAEKDRFRKIIESFQRNHIVLLSTHDLEFAEQICNNMLLINNGKLCFHQAQDAEADKQATDAGKGIHYLDVYNQYVEHQNRQENEYVK